MERLVEDAFSWIESFAHPEKDRPPLREERRLDRMRSLVDLFNHPEEGLPIIHIAGSKGKGSTAILIASQMRSMGLRVGLYLSPHLSFYTERITLAGTPFADDLYIKNIGKIQKRLSSLSRGHVVEQQGGPSPFELLTLLGFLIFQEAQCDWIVVETGMGGRFDPTNVVLPRLSIITHVEYEHTEILGETLAQIAYEKGGIIKPHTPVLCGEQDEEVLAVLRMRAEEEKATFLHLPMIIDDVTLRPSLEGSHFSFTWKRGGQIGTTLSLLGSAQKGNAALASVAVRHLFPRVSPKVQERGLAEGFLPGRMEILAHHPLIIIDAAHTVASITHFMESLDAMGIKGGILIFGCLKDKRARPMISLLANHFSRVIITTPGFFKKSDPHEIFRFFQQEQNEGVSFLPHPHEALKKARHLSSEDNPLVITGSLYLVGEIRRALERSSPRREKKIALSLFGVPAQVVTPDQPSPEDQTSSS